MTRYDQDFYAWTQEQATLLKEKRLRSWWPLCRSRIATLPRCISPG
jgi:hypothetical protein